MKWYIGVLQTVLISRLAERHRSVCLLPCLLEQVNGQKKHTAVHNDTVNCVFDEMLFFNLPNQSVSDLQKEVIEVSVFDSNHVSRNSLIGLYEFDLLSVYYNPNHEVSRLLTRHRAARRLD